ncbi:MAG: type II secretion system secretin GspD [Bdellovibrionales bacterium]
MRQQAGIAFLWMTFTLSVLAAPIGQKNKISFDQALPEDISNENFPDIIESFDYPNADILDLVKAIGKLTGLNFIVDPAVSSKKITVIAPSKITVAEAYKAFLSALAINGYALVKSGAFWKIQETQKALKDNTEIYSGDYFPNTDQLITRIIKLKYINAKEFSDSIKYLLSQNNQISSHTSSNSIIISDYGSVIERIMKIVYAMDTPGSKESVQIIPIQHAAAEDLAEILSNLLDIEQSSSKRRLTPRSSKKSQNALVGYVKISNIISDSRTNSLVVSANAPGLVRVKNLIKKLDTYIDPSRTGGIYVYNVLYGTAEQVYNTLIGIGDSSSRSGSSSKRQLPFRFGGSSSRSRGLNSGKKNSPLFENVTILPDINTNSLIISAKNKYDFERVKEVLKKIDIPRDQVFVQAVIVEMLVDEGDRWEINLASALTSGLTSWLDFFNIKGTPIAGFLNRSFSADPSFLQRSKLGPGLVLGLPLSDFLRNNNMSVDGNYQSKSFQDLIASDAFQELTPENQRSAMSTFNRSSTNSALNQALNLSAVPLLQVLKKAGNVNVLSTPQITALDNITASIEVGENAPVGITNTSSSLAVSQNSVDRQDVTLKLEITPRINPDSGTIQMDINQKFDDFSERQSTASELQNKGVHIVKRNIETKMILHDGETAVLGGLLTDKETVVQNKVPILGDLPILGWLFKGSDIKKEKRNLIVFITPTIIKGKDQKKQMKNLLSKKLEERIYFIRKNMKGRDPHGEYLKKLKVQNQFEGNDQAPTLKDSDLDLEEILEPEDIIPAVPNSKSLPALPKTPEIKLDNNEEDLMNFETFEIDDIDFQTQDPSKKDNANKSLKKQPQKKAAKQKEAEEKN